MAGFSLTYNSKATVTSGLRASYFDNVAWSGEPRLVRTDPAVNFDWGVGSPLNDGIFPVDNFSGKWTGTITVPTTGAYFFGGAVDDSMSVKVNGATVFTGSCCVGLAWSGKLASRDPAFPALRGAAPGAQSPAWPQQRPSAWRPPLKEIA